MAKQFCWWAALLPAAAALGGCGLGGLGCSGAVGRPAAPRAGPPARMQEGMSGERVWPNLSGERVTKRPRKAPRPASGGPGGEPEAPDRRALIVGVLGTAVWLPRLLPALLGPPAAPPAVSTTADDGDCVTSPALETALLATVAEARGGALSTPQFYEADSIVRQLEARGGSQLYASSSPGRWVIPWVGGWERLWASDPDASFVGGPADSALSLSADIKTRLAPGASLWKQVSCRQFVYGPGADGIHIEYVYRSPGVPSELLLARSGAVSNRGGNFFQLDFAEPLVAFEADSVKAGDGTMDALATGVPLVGGTPQNAGKSTGLELQTTYLSERMWVVRDLDGRAAAFQRTETRSVMDRRGLVADGQMKPPTDDGVRYGKLLFGENLSDYQGWEAKTEAEQGGAQLIKDKLYK